MPKTYTATEVLEIGRESLGDRTANHAAYCLFDKVLAQRCNCGKNARNALRREALEKLDAILEK